jgi:hypothetical protein
MQNPIPPLAAAEQRFRGGQLEIRLEPAHRACAILLLIMNSLCSNALAFTADEPSCVWHSRPADNAACAPAPQASQPARKPLRAGWPEAQPEGIHVPKYNMHDMEVDFTLAVADGSKYSISKRNAADLAGGVDNNEMLCDDANQHSSVSSESCHAEPARPSDGWGVDRGEARAARAQKRVVRVQRGESVGSEVSSGRANTVGESAASRPVSRSGSPACLKHRSDRSRSAATLTLSSRCPRPASSTCDGVSPGLAHRSRTRLLEPLEQGDPCGWCKKPLNGSWLMGYDTMHCSEACLRATERSLDGTLWDYDATEAFLREVTLCPDSESSCGHLM